MSMVTTDCYSCTNGEARTLQIPHEWGTLRTCTTTGTSAFHFTCTNCNQERFKEISATNYKILVTLGVEEITWELHPSDQSHGGAPISDDDIAAMFFDLCDDAAIAAELDAYTS